MTSAAQNKTTVLEAFDTLFNKRDYDKVAKFWSPNYIQHSAHIEPGRDGLFNLVKALPHTLRYENQLILAEGDMVMRTGVSTGNVGPANVIAPISCVWRTASSQNIGMSCRTRSPMRSRREDCRCSVTPFLPDVSCDKEDRSRHASTG